MDTKNKVKEGKSSLIKRRVLNFPEQEKRDGNANYFADEVDKTQMKHLEMNLKYDKAFF